MALARPQRIQSCAFRAEPPAGAPASTTSTRRSASTPPAVSLKQNLGNKFLKPERTTETEIGVDAIFQDRFSLQLSRAKTKSVDQLIQIPLPAFYGYTSQWQNAGTVEGNTLEGTLEAQVVNRSNLSWRVGLVADRSRHKITEFNRPCFTTQTIAYRCAGVSLGAMYGFSFLKRVERPAGGCRGAGQRVRRERRRPAGVGRTRCRGQPKKYTQGETPRADGARRRRSAPAATAGAFPSSCATATGSDAVVQIGDGNPDFHWGVSNSVSWNNFDFYALVDAQVGGQDVQPDQPAHVPVGRSAGCRPGRQAAGAQEADRVLRRAVLGKRSDRLLRRGCRLREAARGLAPLPARWPRVRRCSARVRRDAARRSRSSVATC